MEITREMVEAAERARHNYHYTGKAADRFWWAVGSLEMKHRLEAMREALMAALGAVHGEQNDQARMNSESLLPKEGEK